MTRLVQIVSEKNPELVFTIHQGINNKQAEELINYTHNLEDTAIAHQTADWKDGKGRFASQENLNQWLQKGRTIYTLIDQQGVLSGIIWFGYEPMPTKDYRFNPEFNPDLYNLTYAIRIYGNARGIGLAVAFTRAAMSHFKSTPQYKKSQNPGIWLETREDNKAALTTYKQLGAQEVAGPSSTGRILMVFPE